MKCKEAKRTKKQIAKAQAKAFAALTEAQQEKLYNEIDGIVSEYQSQLDDAARTAEDEAAEGIEALYETYGADAANFVVEKNGRADDYCHQCESLSDVVRYAMD